jgi:ParB-like chromosome segregation protein Spo0J
MFTQTTNPNSVAPPEMELLRVSIESDGYTQPIVTMPDNTTHEVVDGFHRHRVGKECVDINTRVHGRLPIVSINESRMDPDEVLRLAQITGLAEMFKDQDFSQAWESDISIEGIIEDAIDE